MLRISHDESANGWVNIRLEGELTGPWVDETRRVCEGARANGQKLRLDLAAVTFVDRAGLKLLTGLQKIDAVLGSCSAFLKAQLHCIRK
jgi:anti-anti-sigma regulatory factor